MQPEETAERYDRIARWYQENVGEGYGLEQLARAVTFARRRGAALDVGCGSSGRFLKAMAQHGYQPEGLDISPAMIELSRERVPDCVYHVGDISRWQPGRGKYDLITAWDSTFHLPLDRQRPALEGMCEGLADGGVLLFTCGGVEGEITGSFAGETFGYSTLGVEEFLRQAMALGCRCRHVEYDQHPESHVTIIVQKD